MFLDSYDIEKYRKASEQIMEKFENIPETAVIAGSGIAHNLNKNFIIDQISYSDLHKIAQPAVAGHSGNVLIYDTGHKTGLIFSGRFHYYEGFSYEEICSLIIIIYLLGIKKVIITNAAGGINPSFKPGDIMIIEDIIDYMFIKDKSIFKGDYDKISYLYKGKSNYNIGLINYLILNKLAFHQGTYSAVTGPSYETRAEIKMFRKFGVDAVGMSTVPEIKVAEYLGLEVFAFSLITNSAKEIMQKVSHEEVIDIAAKSESKVRKFIECCINF